MIYSTMCYLIDNDNVLMLLRNKKLNDINKNKWLGVGGKIYPNETPLECIKREFKEETNLNLHDLEYVGKVSFDDNDYHETIYLYRAYSYDGEIMESNEGELHFVPINKVLELELWEGDKYFLEYVFNNSEFDEITLSYNDGKLKKIKIV